MKKLLTALLVVAMMLSLCSVAFAATYSDTADLNQGAQASIAKLNALNIINGYPDGTYKPTNNITRAEFAKIACIAGGMGKSAQMLQGSPSKFSDVAAGQWYTGYVNLANSQGWVKGFPDGTFRPNNQITYAEVITVLVRILGYNDNLPGPWPVDYIAKAGAIDITKDVSFDANAPATRGDVAVMTDATLDCDVVKWDNDTEDFEEQNYSLLEDKFDTAVNEDYMVTSVEFDDDVWSIKVQATDDDDDDLDGKWLDLADDCMVSDGSLPTGLGSKMVDILYNDDDEVVLYLDITSTMITVDGEDWDVTKTTTIDTVKYPSQYEIDDTKYDVADWVLDKNNVTLLGGFGGDGVAFEDDGFYRAFLNSDKDVYKVARRSEATPAIVEAYDDGELTVKVEGTHPIDKEFTGSAKSEVVDVLDIDFDDDDVLIEKDGAFVGPEDLEENDVIYVDEGSYGYDYYISVAGNISKTGTLDGYRVASGSANFDQIRIDGTWYEVAADNALSDDDGEEFDKYITSAELSDYDDETITYFVNRANQVCFVITGEVGKGGEKIYGVVTDLGYRITGDGNKVTDITVLKADGTETEYGVDTSEVEVYMPKSGITDDLKVDDFIKFSVDEDNDIDSLTILAVTSGTGASAYVDKPTASNDYADITNAYFGKVTYGDDDYNKIKFDGNWYNLTDKTIIFNGSEYRDDDAEVITVADFVDWAIDLADGTGVDAYVQFSGTRVEYIFVNNDVASGAGADYTAITDLYSRGGDNWAEVDILGEEKNYEVKSGYASAEIGMIYEYSLSSGDIKFDTLVFDPTAALTTVAAGAYGPSTEGTSYIKCKVEDVDKSANAVKLANGTWIYVTEDTVVYDYDGGAEDVEYKANVRFITKNDYVIYFGDEKELDLLVVVTDL